MTGREAEIGEPRAVAGDVECVILGSGTSAGVPVIGCDCVVCTSDDPRDRRSRPSACLRFRDPEGKRRILLIDASPDLREQAIRFRLDRCDAILFTHAHFDHIFGLDDVRSFNALMHAPIDIYAERLTLDALERVYDYIFRRDFDPNPSWVASLVSHEIAEARPYELFGLRITPLRVFHGRLPILGFRIDLAGDENPGSHREGPLPLAYLTDVSRIPDETWPFLDGLETLVLDMLRYRRHPTHFSVDEAVEAAGRIGATRTWFIHMTHDILHRDLDSRLPQGMSLAYDGLALRAKDRS